MRRLLLFAAFFILFFSQMATFAAERPVVKIGVILPLTGDLAFLGEAFRNGYLLALHDSPDTKLKYELVFEDVQYSAPKAAIALQKLLKVDHADAIFCFADQFGKIINPFAEKDKFVHICFSSDNSVAQGDYNFTMGPQPDDEAAIFAQSLKKRGIKKVALITQKDTYALALLAAQRKVLPKLGIQIISDQEFGGSERDFRPLILKAKESKPDFLILTTFSPCLDLLSKQLLESNTHNFGGMETFENTDDRKPYNGMWYVNQPNPTPKFTKDYQDTYHGKAIVGTANSYDMLNLYMQVSEKLYAASGKKPTEAQIQKELAATKNFHGALGDYTQDADGVFHVPPVEKIIKDGEPAPIQ